MVMTLPPGQYALLAYVASIAGLFAAAAQPKLHRARRETELADLTPAVFATEPARPEVEPGEWTFRGSAGVPRSGVHRVVLIENGVRGYGSD